MGFLITLLAGRVGSLAAYAIVYGILAAIVGGTLLGIRHHLIKEGWNLHAAAVEKQDNSAIAASKEVQRKTDACSDANGFWDVITQGCKTQDSTEEKK